MAPQTIKVLVLTPFQTYLAEMEVAPGPFWINAHLVNPNGPLKCGENMLIGGTDCNSRAQMVCIKRGGCVAGLNQG